MPISRKKKDVGEPQEQPKKVRKPKAQDESIPDPEETRDSLGESATDATASSVSTESQDSQLSLQDQSSSVSATNQQPENQPEPDDDEGMDETAKQNLLDEVESVFGTGFEDESEDEEEEEPELEIDPDSAPFLNCAEFKLTEITKKNDRLFSFKFTADSVKGESDWNQTAEEEDQTPFEKVFEEIGEMIAPQVFPNQTKLELISITRNTKQVKKQPVTFVVFEVASRTGLVGSVSKSAKIPIDRLGEAFGKQFAELENKVHEELRERRNQYEQQTLDFDE